MGTFMLLGLLTGLGSAEPAHGRSIRQAPDQAGSGWLARRKAVRAARRMVSAQLDAAHDVHEPTAAMVREASLDHGGWMFTEHAPWWGRVGFFEGVRRTLRTPFARQVHEDLALLIGANARMGLTGVLPRDGLRRFSAPLATQGDATLEAVYTMPWGSEARGSLTFSVTRAGREYWIHGSTMARFANRGDIRSTKALKLVLEDALLQIAPEDID